MEAIPNTQPTGLIITKTTTKGDVGQYQGVSASKFNSTRKINSNPSLNEAPSLKDRLTYPLRAAKNRILDLSALGAKTGFYIPTYGAGAILALAGGIIGGTVGRLIKYQFFPNAESSPLTFGATVGFIAGFFLACPAGIVLGIVTTTAFTIISPAYIIFTFPVDIYNAITLNNKADMYPEKSTGKEFWNNVRQFKFNDTPKSH